MKILVVSDLYPLISDRSIPFVIEDFVLALKQKVEKIEVIRPNFLLNTFLRKHKFVKTGIYLKNGIKVYNRNFILPFVCESKNFINNLKEFNLIISHMPSGHIYSDLINKYLNIAHVSIVHQSDLKVLENFKYKFYFKKRLKNALLNSNLVGARNIFLMNKFKADFVLPSFVLEENILEEKIFKGDKLRLITLSKLIKRKNIDVVIKALSKIDFDFEYNIYGDGPQKKYLKNLISAYKLENKIKINGFIEHDKIYTKLDKNDVFILPSVDETFGVAYLEALSRGLVVVATKNTGIDGIIQNGENGFLINPSIDSVVDVLYKIKGTNLKEISENSINTIKNYEKEKVMSKYFENLVKISMK